LTRELQPAQRAVLSDMVRRSSLQEHVLLEVTSRGVKWVLLRAICERKPRAVRVRRNPLEVFYKYNLPHSPQFSHFTLNASLCDRPFVIVVGKNQNRPTPRTSAEANDGSAPPDLDSLHGLPSKGLRQICAPPPINGGSVVEATRSSRRPLRTKELSR
jgi:hypothetical protein